MMTNTPDDLDQLDAHQLRELARQLMLANARKDQDITFKAARITALSHEIAILRRHKFGQKSEQCSGQVFLDTQIRRWGYAQAGNWVAGLASISYCAGDR